MKISRASAIHEREERAHARALGQRTNEQTSARAARFALVLALHARARVTPVMFLVSGCPQHSLSLSSSPSLLVSEMMSPQQSTYICLENNTFSYLQHLS